MTVDEWNAILSAGYDYIEWNVVAKETTIPSTGPYTSETVRLYTPEATRLNLNIGISDGVGYDDFEWYIFTASSTGYYTFYTIGNSDTYGEFFIMPSANYTVVNRFTYDNDSGEGSNFSKNIYLPSGQTIYIRVRGGLNYYACSYILNAVYTPSC